MTWTWGGNVVRHRGWQSGSMFGVARCSHGVVLGYCMGVIGAVLGVVLRSNGGSVGMARGSVWRRMIVMVLD